VLQAVNPMRDYCLELSKIEDLKMLDLQTKSAIDQLDLLVLVQATNQERGFRP
jgi:hypothetical protein